MEVTDLLLSFGQVLVDGLLLGLHLSLLRLQFRDVNLDLFLAVVQLGSQFAQLFNFVDFGVLAELRVQVVIVVIVFVLFLLFFVEVVAIFVIVKVVILNLLRSSLLLRYFLVEVQDLVVVFVICVDQFVELRKQLAFLLFDLLNLVSLGDQLLGNSLNLLNNESLLFSALLQLIGKSFIFRHH